MSNFFRTLLNTLILVLHTHQSSPLMKLHELMHKNKGKNLNLTSSEVLLDEETKATKENQTRDLSLHACN